MGEIRDPLSAKLFAGMISSDPALFDACGKELSAAYGPIDFSSDPVPWDISDYYRDEMGGNLLRKFIFFDRLVDPAVLSSVKLFTDRIEKRFSRSDTDGSHRRINIDPGYVTEAKVVLASSKDFSHRIYIGDGIYAEVTLMYRTGEHSFVHLPHTFLDFRTASYIKLFNTSRNVLREALKQLPKRQEHRREDV